MNRHARTGKFVATKFAATILVVTIITGLFVVSPVTSSLTSRRVVGSSGRVGAPDTRPLHVEGSYIKDDLGNVIYLRGVNYGGYNNYPNGWWSGQGGTMQQHFSAMQSWGMNVIRYTLTMAWWTRDEQNHRQYLKDAVVTMQDYGLYAILAPWRYDEGTGQMGDPLDHMTLNEYVDWWIDVLNELNTPTYLPNIIVDPCNEPLAACDEWQNTVQALVNGIRGAGHDYVVLYQHGYGAGPNQKGQWGGWITDWWRNYPLTGTNIAISTHLYIYSYSTDYATLKQEMDTAEIDNVATDLNMPLVVGEIGASSDTERVWFDNCLTILNEWELGWAVWTWNYGVGWAVREGTSFDPNTNGQILLDHIGG